MTYPLLWHSAGSILHAQTGDLKLTQKGLGQAKISTISDIYLYLEEKTLKLATALLAGKILVNCARTSRMVR